MGTVILVLLIVGGYIVYFLSLRWERRDLKAEKEAEARAADEAPEEPLTERGRY